MPVKRSISKQGRQAAGEYVAKVGARPKSIVRATLSAQLRAANTERFEELFAHLTNAEQLVLQRFLNDPNDRRIARRLGLCVQTVRNQLAAIENKLQLESRAHMLVKFLIAVFRESDT